MNYFDRLNKVVDLWKQKRKKAAIAIWREFPSAFKHKLIQLAVFVHESPDITWKGKFATLYGEVQINNQWLKEMSVIVAEVASDAD